MATATYTNGREDEYDVERRQNAERAFFEWVPIDAGLGDDGELEIGADDLGGTMMEENVVSAAGARFQMPIERIERLVRDVRRARVGGRARVQLGRRLQVARAVR